MAPVVHGLAKQYAGQVDFLYLYVGDPRNRQALDRLGFVATPHFFFLRPDGSRVSEMRGVVPRDSVASALEQLLVTSGR